MVCAAVPTEVPAKEPPYLEAIYSRSRPSFKRVWTRKPSKTVMTKPDAKKRNGQFVNMVLGSSVGHRLGQFYQQSTQTRPWTLLSSRTLIWRGPDPQIPMVLRDRSDCLERHGPNRRRPPAVGFQRVQLHRFHSAERRRARP